MLPQHCSGGQSLHRSDVPAAGHHKIGFAALIGSAVLPARSLLLGQVVRLRALEKIGVVSYGIYLWHDPLVLAAARHGLYTGNPMLNTAVTAVAATVIAVASWIVLERRLLALKRPSAPRERTEPLAVSELARTPQVTAA